MAFVHFVILGCASLLLRNPPGRETGRQRARALAAVSTATATIPSVPCITTTINEREPPPPPPPRQQQQGLCDRKLFDFSDLSDPKFLGFTFCSILLGMGYLVPFYFFPNYMTSRGLSPRTASLVIGVAHISTTIGRIVLGFASDKVGAINCVTLTVIIAGACVLGIWPVASIVPTMVIFALTYGFASGGFMCLIPTVAVQLRGR